MTTNEMKNILFKKLQDEGCYFQKSDISIKQTKEGYKVVIKDYEHNPFTITTEKDDYFGYIVYVNNDSEEKNIIFADSKKDYDFTSALVRLGYYIGTRF